MEQAERAINFGQSADEKINAWMLRLLALLGMLAVAYLIMIITYYVLEKNEKREEARLEDAKDNQRFAA